MRVRRNTEETNFWAGYADCMLALFMIALLLWILSAGITAFTNEANATILVSKEDQISELKAEIDELKKAVAKKDAKISELEKLLGGSKSVMAELDRLRDDNEILRNQLDRRRDEIETLKEEHEKLLLRFNKLTQEFEALNEKHKKFTETLKGKDVEHLVDKLAKLEKELNDKPPVINLTEGVAKEFSFVSGKADLPESFNKRLKEETFPELHSVLENYERIDTLEIIGHTDGRPIGKKGNLDSAIPKLMSAESGQISLTPGSNTDLGLMRALAIRNAWLKWIEAKPKEDQAKLKSIAVRCYSAAQTIPPNGAHDDFDWLAENAAARRIEIRFIQLK